MSVVYRNDAAMKACYVLMHRSQTTFSDVKEACLRRDGDYAI